MVLTPKGEDFAWRQAAPVCLLDDPPGPPNFDEPFRFTGTALGRLLNYLFDTFPIGTPLEQLDVDIGHALEPTAFQRPAVEMWVVNVAGSMLADVISPNATNLQMARGR